MKTTKLQVPGMMLGAVLGAVPPLWWWETTGKLDPSRSLAWGIPINFFALPLGLLGAIIGAYVGSKIIMHKK